MPISDAIRAEAQVIAKRYPVARSGLLPMLHLVQSDEGYVSEDGIALCASVLGLTKAEVGAVATFYTMYKREPFGDYLLSVCTNPTCQVAGAQDIYESYVKTCGGHIDTDGSGVMVEHAECLGICDAAPVVQINYEMYGPVSKDEAMDLLAKAKAGDPPASNRSGEVPPTFKQVHREFAGMEDGVDEQLAEAARLQAGAEVPPAYRTGETDLPVTHPGGDPSGHGGDIFREQAGFEAAGPDTSTATIDGTPNEVTKEVAAVGPAGEQELAQHLEEPTGPATPANEQPAVDGVATSPEAEGRARGAEADTDVDNDVDTDQEGA